MKFEQDDDDDEDVKEGKGSQRLEKGVGMLTCDGDWAQLYSAPEHTPFKFTMVWLDFFLFFFF